MEFCVSLGDQTSPVTVQQPNVINVFPDLGRVMFYGEKILCFSLCSPQVALFSAAFDRLLHLLRESLQTHW